MTAHIKIHNGTPTLFLDGQPAFDGLMWSSPPAPDSWGMAPVARRFAEAGIHLYAFDVGTQGSPPEWPGGNGSSPAPEADFDFSTVEARFNQVIAADPQARFHLRVHLEMPAWWQNRYPEECERVSNGERRMQSFASRMWREQAKAFLRAYIAHIRAIGMAGRVIAYQTGAGTTGEWVKETAMSRPAGDYSRPMREHFRAWLRQHYGHEDALRAAWNDPAARFETAEVPTEAQQATAARFCFRDPQREQPVIDYYRCLAELCGDLVVDFNRTVKEASGGDALAGAFFGYLMELAWNSSFFGGGVESETAATQRSGHLGLRRALESPHVDFIVSPYSYGFRGLGGEGAPMPPTESARLHGKLYVYEEDSRTHLSAHETDYGKVYTLPDAEAVLKRNFALILSRGLGIWWLGGSPEYPHIDPEREPAFRSLLRRFQELGTFALRLDRRPAAEIAVLLDDESYLHQAPQNDLDLPLVFQQRLWGLPRLGAPYDLYLMQDLVEDRLPPYKLYVFLNAFALDQDRRDRLARAVRRAGRTALWIYAPGYSKPGASPALSLDHMTELTGFRFGLGDHPWGPLMHLTDLDHPITRGLPQDLQWGTNSRIGPLFHIEDPAAAVLGQVVYSVGRCKPGFGVKRLPAPGGGEWTSVYIAAPNVPAPVLRGVARHSGVHLYSEAGDVLYAAPQLLAAHTAAGGARTFRLPSPVEVVYDLFANRVVARGADRFDAALPKASTMLYYTGDIQTLRHLPDVML
jgi:hypothetical protein